MQTKWSKVGARAVLRPAALKQGCTCGGCSWASAPGLSHTHPASVVNEQKCPTAQTGDRFWKELRTLRERVKSPPHLFSFCRPPSLCSFLSQLGNLLGALPQEGRQCMKVGHSDLTERNRLESPYPSFQLGDLQLWRGGPTAQVLV